MEEEVKSLSDYIDIIRRHKFWVLATAIIFIAISAVVAYVLPATYKSEGLILIESQEIPGDLIRSTVTSYAAQRIEVIKQRSMTTNNVMSIVDKFNLYSEMRKKSPPSAIVALFRQNVSVNMVEANVTDPQSGRAKRATIAFTVSFMDGSPVLAQKVANELVTTFLDQNVKTRTDRAIETTAFLNDEAGKFQRKVQQIEQQISDFKNKYSDSLPELLEFNLSTIERLQEELVTNQNQVMQLKDQISAMTMDQANLRFYTTPNRTGSTESGPSAELADAEAALSKLQTRYSANHPDVLQLKRQVATLREELGIEGDSTDVSNALSAAKQELADLKQRYADNHPDVKRLANQVAGLEKQQSTQKPKVKKQSSYSNPLYHQLASKIQLAEREIVRLQERQVTLREKLADYENRVVQTYKVEREYDDLTRDHANHLAKYQELRSKQLEAELAQNLESENKGESFTLIEPPLVPSTAEKPNRKKILAMGVIASIGLGIGLALLLDMIKGGVRGYNAITHVTGRVPLVVVPVIDTANDLKNRTNRKKWWFLGAILVLIVGVVGFHFFVMNLEVFWFKALRKLSLI